MSVFFIESLLKQLSLKANVKLKCDQNAYAEHILFACMCEVFKDGCLVYFCTTCYETSQFVFYIYYSNAIFEVCLLLV